jgi:pyruvate carboxylase
MYPEVFRRFATVRPRIASAMSALPTPAFFYGMRPARKFPSKIEAGKTLFIKLVNIGVDDEGKRDR